MAGNNAINTAIITKSIILLKIKKGLTKLNILISLFFIFQNIYLQILSIIQQKLAKANRNKDNKDYQISTHSKSEYVKTIQTVSKVLILEITSNICRMMRIFLISFFSFV